MGPTKGAYRAVMSSLELWVAYNVTPCGKSGHSLRDRAGNCVVCKTANLAYMRRHDEDGEVYVAESASRGWVKVGTGKIASERVCNLSNYPYAGCHDWELTYFAKCRKAGSVELQIHRALAHFSTRATYYSHGRETECLELFSCASKKAIAAVKEALQRSAFDFA